MDLSSIPLYAIPVSTIIIGLSIGLIKYSEYIQSMYISNANLIMRQGDQISFLIKRLVELNKKINNLELEFTTLSTKSYFTYDDEELEETKDELVADELVADELVADELVADELVADELVADELVVKEEVFEIIDATIAANTNTNTNTTVASKKNGWFSF
jgi:hypothetical protein